jgi:hypothetical protein
MYYRKKHKITRNSFLKILTELF